MEISQAVYRFVNKITVQRRNEKKNKTIALTKGNYPCWTVVYRPDDRNFVQRSLVEVEKKTRGSSSDESQRGEPEFTFNGLVNFPLCSVYDRDGKVRSSLSLAGRTRKSVLEIDNR